jgi:hypothetical protein
MSNKKKESGARGSKDNSSEATLKRSGKASKTQESGPRATGKSVDAAVSRRDDHPGKQKERSYRDSLIADQRVSGFDTGTLGPESFPEKSTADSKKLAARRRKD